MFQRLLNQRLTANTRNVLVLGARQTGKSTLLRGLRPDWEINLASPAAFRDYVAHPERLEAELRAAGPEVRTVFLDEVQRVPALLDVVQVVHDTWPGRFRFLLSGSSARKLRRGGANLLPGRVHAHALHPLLAAEIGEAFDVERAMTHGTLPGIYAENDPALRAADLRSYVDAYLREEIQAEALVRDLGGYARLLDLVAASSGAVLNLQSLCQQAGIAHQTARRYIEVLDDTLITFRVDAWAGSSRASLVAHPRIFLFDAGVRNALLRRPLDRPSPDERGVLFEHLVAYELWRRAGDLWPEAAVYHFRTRHGAEVDFVLEVGREIWAVEAKSTTHLPAVRERGFDALAERTAVARRIVVYLGERRAQVDGVEVIPFFDFAAELPR